MKKSLFCMLLLFLLSCGALGVAHRMVADTSDEILLTETSHVGDPSAASDLQLQFSWGEDQQLFWDTTFLPGQSAQTTFSFYPTPVNVPPEPQPFELYLPTYFNSGHLSSVPIEFSSTDESSLTPLYQAVSERTKAGFTHSEILTLQDYYDTYPLDIKFSDYQYYPEDFLQNDVWSSDAERKEFLLQSNFIKQLNDAFRFPVPSDHQICISVSKGSDGGVYQADIIDSPLSSAPADVPYEQGASDAPSVSVGDSPARVDFMTFNASTDSDYYFILEARRTDGMLLDYSLTPGGYGIYRMPLGEKLPDASKLELVYSMQPQQHVEFFQLDDRGARLLLFTSTDGLITMHILDSETGAEQQSFPVRKISETETWTRYINQDNLIAVFQDDIHFQLYSQDDAGDYHYQFSGTLPDVYDNTTQWGCDFSIAYNGDHFVLVSTGYHAYDEPSCGFSLMVWDKDQLLYAGTFNNSLNQSPSPGRFRINSRSPSIRFT